MGHAPSLILEYSIAREQSYGPGLTSPELFVAEYCRLPSTFEVILEFL
jgi:hypothetical protein